MDFNRHSEANCVPEQGAIPVTPCAPIPPPQAGQPWQYPHLLSETLRHSLSAESLAEAHAHVFPSGVLHMVPAVSKEKAAAADSVTEAELKRKRRREHEELTRAAELQRMLSGMKIAVPHKTAVNEHAHDELTLWSPVALYRHEPETPAVTKPMVHVQRGVAEQCHVATSHRRTSAGEQVRREVQIEAARMAVVTRVYEARKNHHQIIAAHAIVPSAKGFVVLAPGGATDASPRALASMIASGAALHPRGLTRAASLNLVVALPSGSQPSIPYLQFLARRVAVAVGRDPDLHVVASVHVPERHAAMGADGAPIHPHIHLALATFDPITGAAWRCPHLHIVANRELVAIDVERWGTSNAPAIAGGKSLGLLFGADRLKCELETADGKKTTVSLDGEAVVAAKAAIVAPATLLHEPPAGLVVTRPASTPESSDKKILKVLRTLEDARTTIATGNKSVCISIDDAVWAAQMAAEAAPALIHAVGVQHRTSVDHVMSCALALADASVTRAYAVIYEVQSMIGNAITHSMSYDKG